MEFEVDTIMMISIFDYSWFCHNCPEYYKTFRHKVYLYNYRMLIGTRLSDVPTHYLTNLTFSSNICWPSRNSWMAEPMHLSLSPGSWIIVIQTHKYKCTCVVRGEFMTWCHMYVSVEIQKGTCVHTNMRNQDRNRDDRKGSSVIIHRLLADIKSIHMMQSRTQSQSSYIILHNHTYFMWP